MRIIGRTIGTGAAAQQPSGDVENLSLQWGVKIPMRDGVELNATLYRPKDNTPVPALFTLTPYIADSYHERAVYFAGQGYPFALIDCRGRGNSGGTFKPFATEADDAYDIIAWLAAQPWCNGSVAMWGGSYAGYNQWLALREQPPALKTIVPAAAAHAGVDFPFLKNIFYPYEIQWLTYTSGVTGNEELFSDQGFWISRFRERYFEHRPFRALDALAGNENQQFQEWVDHPHPDAYWDRLALTPSDYDGIALPILTITGHYDGDQPGALHYYHQHMASSSPTRHQHYLIIGPWDHGGTRTPQREVGGLEFAQEAIVDLNALHAQWYGWTMLGGEKPEFLKKRVAYYLMGCESWRYADSLDTISNRTRRLYLNSTGGYANDVFHSGFLQEAPPEAAPPDHYVYDPLDVRPAELEREQLEDYLTNQRYALNLYGNGLVYHTAPFPQDTEVSGFVRLELWLALDVPDTDFQVTLSEVLFDGAHIQLTEDYLRARYRYSPREPVLVEPGAVERYVFDGFTFFARQVARGSRLRLVISSPNTIFLQKNYNSGGSVVDESGSDARTARVTLYHDREYPSFLELPLVDNDKRA